jgi:small GTP-binding protein
MSELILRVILLGDSNVGKTSLIMRYIKNEFKNSFISTIGVEYDSKIIKKGKKDICLEIIDTGGQEKFHCLTKSFFNKVDGIIFVFDLTNKESFENLKNWLKEAESYTEDFEYILVGNKKDLINSIEVNQESLKDNDLFNDTKYFEVSAKTGENIEECFEELTDLILNKIKKTQSFNDFNKNNSFYIKGTKYSGKNNNKSIPCC